MARYQPDLPLACAKPQGLIERREVSPLELTDACIARAEALDATLHAYITTTFDTARAGGEGCERGNRRGQLPRPAARHPVRDQGPLRDRGRRTTAGSQLREHYVPARTRARSSCSSRPGIVMLGKLNLHEWAMGGTNVNEYFPTPRNPWDTERVTGGSSGGSGAALAAGYCYGSLGTDTRGSIRIPAALCGITGIKPTYGRVSIRGIVPLNWSLDHSGPMARTAEDCALILNAIAGYDEQRPHDAPTCPYPTTPPRLTPTPLDGVRVGIPRNFFLDADVVEPVMISSTKAVGETLASLGAEVVDVDFPEGIDFQQSTAFFAEASWLPRGAVQRAPGDVRLDDPQAHDRQRRHIGRRLRTRPLAAARAAAGGTPICCATSTWF